MSVTDKQARAIVSKGDVHVFPCAVGELASDLLATRAALRAVCEAGEALMATRSDQNCDLLDARAARSALAAARKLL